MDFMPITLFVLLIVTGIVAYFVGNERDAEHDKLFPPISDEEFIKRCGPGTNPDVAIKVRRIISKHLNVEYDRIHPSSRFVEDLHAG